MSVSSHTVSGKTKYKIVLLGNQHVGKTAIIDRFINDRFEPTYNATIGIDFLVRNITHNSRTYRLQLWDTAGQQRFKSLIPSYLKDSNMCIIVYDVNCAASLEDTSKWLELYNMHRDNGAFSILVGNKADIEKRQCTPQMIETKVKKLKLPHYLISAKTGEEVQNIFLKIIDMINDKVANMKIIEQIDEKVEEKVEEEETAKPSVVEGGKSYSKKIKLDQQQKTVIQGKAMCC